jgi:hypothetical protein
VVRARQMKTWVETLIADLADEGHWSYQPRGRVAAEPTAIAAIALAAHGRLDAADRACRRLVDLQAADGSVGIAADESTPCWATGWAVLAWEKMQTASKQSTFADRIERAIDSILALHGRTFDTSSEMGHNTRLDGWPWVAGTHPWAEPTAINLLALKATGRGQHPRAREAAEMLLDRLLPDGGCNYGNTTVLGQVLRPHVEPTGLALLALAGKTDATGRLVRTVSYLENAVTTTPGGASLAYGVMGLAAHDRRPASADGWLAAAARQVKPYLMSPLRKALLALAAAEPCPFACD